MTPVIHWTQSGPPPAEKDTHLFKSNVPNQYILDHAEDATQQNRSCPETEAQPLKVPAGHPRALPSSFNQAPPVVKTAVDTARKSPAFLFH